MTIRLSNLQFTMLATFAEQPLNYHMTIEEAAKFDQRPFRSMLVRQYVVFRPGRGFHLTREGRAAHEDFLTTEIWRKNVNGPLTTYFDPTAYSVHVARGAA
jgi:hypothetical protein